MPILAVVGAGAALFGGGAAAIGSVIAGTASLVTTLEAVAAVGSVLGAVGAVTGDKTLSTVGMVIGGIGGIGALAGSAGLLGAGASTDSLFGVAPAASTGSAATSDFDALTAQQDDAVYGASSDSSLINGPSSYAAGAVTSAPLPDVINSLSGQGTEEMYQSGAMPGQDSLSTAAASPQQAANPASDALSQPAATPVAAPATQTVQPAAVTTTTPATPAPVTGTPSAVSTADQNWYKLQYPNGAPEGTTLKNVATGNSFTITNGSLTPTTQGSGIMDFLKTAGGGTLGMGVLQAGGAFLQGAFNPLTPAQVSAYNAQAAANNAAAAVTQQQAANMNSPIPVARRVASAPVTGTPAAQQPGIINQPMQGAA